MSQPPITIDEKIAIRKVLVEKMAVIVDRQKRSDFKARLITHSKSTHPDIKLTRGDIDAILKDELHAASDEHYQKIAASLEKMDALDLHGRSVGMASSLTQERKLELRKELRQFFAMHAQHPKMSEFKKYFKVESGINDKQMQFFLEDDSDITFLNEGQFILLDTAWQLLKKKEPELTALPMGDEAVPADYRMAFTKLVKGKIKRSAASLNIFPAETHEALNALAVRAGKIKDRLEPLIVLDKHYDLLDDLHQKLVHLGNVLPRLKKGNAGEKHDLMGRLRSTDRILDGLEGLPASIDAAKNLDEKEEVESVFASADAARLIDDIMILYRDIREVLPKSLMESAFKELSKIQPNTSTNTLAPQGGRK